MTVRFEIETKLIQEANEDTFAIYRSWLRYLHKKTAVMFEGVSRDAAKAAAVQAARAIVAAERDKYSFVCKRDQVGI